MSKKLLDKFLQGEVHSISVLKALSNNHTLIDVRTVEEFASGSIPGALNFPLFDQLERSLIGTLYKQIGRDAAILQGKSLVAPQMKRFLGSLLPFKSSQLTVFCARGGMRSGSVTRFLKQEGFKVRQLEGGYKRYRQVVLHFLQTYSPSLIVLHGQTGVGKTRLLQLLPDSIDLEDLAQHRSSLFGAIHKTPRNQKTFDALLHRRCRELPAHKMLFIEGESSKVGQVFIPRTLLQAMKTGRLVLLHASRETRVRRLLEEYRLDDEATVRHVDAILQTLIEPLGRSAVHQLRQLLRKQRIAEIIEMLLDKYYDPRYRHAMRGYQYDLEVSAEDIELAAIDVESFRRRIENYENI